MVGSGNGASKWVEMLIGHVWGGPVVGTTISKGSLAGCLVQLDAGSTDRLAQQNLQIPEHAHNRTLPSWLFNAYLPARDRRESPLVVPTPFWSPRYLKNPNCQPLLMCTRCRNHGNPAEMYAELTNSMSI